VWTNVGDVSSFQADLSIHIAIARTAILEGTYKLSLHSGLDKVSIYLALVHQTLVHF
jgi:hypothetical protein